jgi:tRNA (guanine6-N2)-methyltransferase
VGEAQQRYFARVTAGLEQIAWPDVERSTGARLIGFGHRRIDFAYSGPPATLLGLRSVDDVYVYVARLSGIERTRASLARLTEQLGRLDFAPALAACTAVRPLPVPPSYRVTASHLGKRNYSRYDVEGAVEAAISQTLPWRFILNDSDEPEPDLDVRILIEDDWALIGLRLGAAPLHRRAYKIASRPGSLKPPVAYCLGLLAELAPQDTVLDPTCGAGTIVVEAAALATAGVIAGGDGDVRSIALAQENVAAAGLEARVVMEQAQVAGMIEAARHLPRPLVILYLGDATAAPLANASVAAVVTNLPWGQQAPVAGDLSALYSGILRQVERVLRAGGRAVLLTDQPGSFQGALASCDNLRLSRSFQISLFGRHPTVFVLSRSG